jgi:hypothetical protein
LGCEGRHIERTEPILSVGSTDVLSQEGGDGGERFATARVGAQAMIVALEFEVLNLFARFAQGIPHAFAL